MDNHRPRNIAYLTSIVEIAKVNNRHTQIVSVERLVITCPCGCMKPLETITLYIN